MAFVGVEALQLALVMRVAADGVVLAACGGVAAQDAVPVAARAHLLPPFLRTAFVRRSKSVRTAFERLRCSSG